MSALGLVGALIAALAAGWYVYTILRKRNPPPSNDRGCTWALIGALGAGSAVEGGAGPGAYVALVYLALHLVVFVLSLSKRFGQAGVGSGTTIRWA